MNLLARQSGLLAAVALVLAACGGGGELAAPASTAATSNPTNTTTSAAPGPSTLESPTMVSSTPVSSANSDTGSASTQANAPAFADCGHVDMPSQILRALNAQRAQGADCRSRGAYGAANPVQWNLKLEASALAHSKDMVDRNFFDHTSSNGNTLVDRVNATGYVWSRLGENIAANYGSVDQVVAAWMASDGHCANMMNPNFAEIGMVCLRGTAANQYSNYWTLNFGTTFK